MSLMCHKPLLFQTIKQQQGSALVVALFIIIVMGFTGRVYVQITGQQLREYFL